jgi:DNA segregation ATPase FtsK/SpoIIIE-like protein
MPTPQLRKQDEGEIEKPNICLFAQTNYRNQMRRFGIKLDDRRRHMYVIGKTGMGKTTLMENMVLSDIYSGYGVGVVDPHGDFAEKILDYIPNNRINDVVYFNPSDMEFPVGFNILEVINEEQKHLVVAGLMSIFKKIWQDLWSARMEYILNNTLLALVDNPGSTLLGINRMLADKKYRKRIVSKVKDPVIKAFWQNEFANYPEKYMVEAVAPIQNKIGQFLSAGIIRNMVSQVKSTINVRQIMDGQKIFIMNLSKGRIGEDNSRLLGGMLITEIQLAAMERVDTLEADRKDFFLYVDEFQNFATQSFANILSEARKYRLALIMAHQYIAQLEEEVADAVFGNVGTMVSFRVGGADAEMLAKEFAPVFTEEDLVNLTKFTMVLKLMIDGVASQPFTAFSMPPIAVRTGNAEKIIKVSRERYGKSRTEIEEKIAKWSGMDMGGDEEDDGGSGEMSSDFHEITHSPNSEYEEEAQSNESVSRQKEWGDDEDFFVDSIEKPKQQELNKPTTQPSPLDKLISADTQDGGDILKELIQKNTTQHQSNQNKSKENRPPHTQQQGQQKKQDQRQKEQQGSKQQNNQQQKEQKTEKKQPEVPKQNRPPQSHQTPNDQNQTPTKLSPNTPITFDT